MWLRNVCLCVCVPRSWLIWTSICSTCSELVTRHWIMSVPSLAVTVSMLSWLVLVAAAVPSCSFHTVSCCCTLWSLFCSFCAASQKTCLQTFTRCWPNFRLVRQWKDFEDRSTSGKDMNKRWRHVSLIHGVLLTRCLIIRAADRLKILIAINRTNATCTKIRHMSSYILHE